MFRYPQRLSPGPAAPDKETVMAAPAQKPKTIEILIDGEPYEIDERELTVGELLALAGRDPASFYLVEIKGQREREPHKDADERIRVHPNSKFVTVSCGETPVS
jgi:hypothetical protein